AGARGRPRVRIRHRRRRARADRGAAGDDPGWRSPLQEEEVASGEWPAPGPGRWTLDAPRSASYLRHHRRQVRASACTRPGRWLPATEGAMAEASARFYLDAPVERIDTGTARLACRRVGHGSPGLPVLGRPVSGVPCGTVPP